MGKLRGNYFQHFKLTFIKIHLTARSSNRLINQLKALYLHKIIQLLKYQAIDI